MGMTKGEQAHSKELSALQSLMQTIRRRNADYIAAEAIAKAKAKPVGFGWSVLRGGSK